MTNQASQTAGLINSNVMFISQDLPMKEAVQLMIDQKISSLLVHDSDDYIVGILTERDIVHKFTLLDMGDKLTRTVVTLMTRPVMFAHVNTLRADITKLHLEHKIRHFPVVQGNTNKKENIVGIVSITDLARQSLMTQSTKKSDQKEEDAHQGVSVGVFCQNHGNTNLYINIFNGMGFKALEILDIHKFLTSKTIANEAVIFDLDGFNDQKLHDLIPIAVKSKAFLVLTTSNPNLIPVFKKYLNHERQEIAMKPLDIGYISWLLTKRWEIKA